jgi:regulator of vacuolar morphogenesis
MPEKRKIASSDLDSPSDTKRSCTLDTEEKDDEDSPIQMPQERPRSDPIYGQKSAFPGLDDFLGDELFYGPPEDGLEYLRMVR